MIPPKNASISLILAHINDTHSYFEPSPLQLNLTVAGHQLQPYVSAGGFARIATRSQQLREQAKQEHKGFLFLHAGDCFQGTLYFSLFKGRANAALLNALHIDAMAIGNHELDMGNAPVAQFLQRIQFPLLAGNWDVSQEASTKTHRVSESKNLMAFNAQQQCAHWIIKEIQGTQVAIFGLSLEQMAAISQPDADTPFLSAISVAKATVSALHQIGIRHIILLSHLGYEADLELAEQVSGIGVIVGGHSHKLQGDFSFMGLDKEEDYGKKVKETYVVQAGYHALALGHAKITFDANGKVIQFSGKNEILLGRRLCQDVTLSSANIDNIHQQANAILVKHPNICICKKEASIHRLLSEKYIPAVRQLQEEVVFETQVYLRHVRIPDENGSSHIAPLVAESFYYYARKMGIEADFAVHNAGGVRSDLYPGQVMVSDIAGRVLPFAIPIGCYQVRGKDVALMLEGALNNALNNSVVGTGSGSYPYTHGLSYQYKKDQPIGRRIEALHIKNAQGKWCAIEPETIYTGVSSAYTLKGKEGYQAILNRVKESMIHSVSMAECFIDFARHHPERFHAALFEETDNFNKNDD